MFQGGERGGGGRRGEGEAPPDSSDTQAGGAEGGQKLLPPPCSALHRLCPLALRLRAACTPPLWLIVLWKKTALSRGWCTPLTRGSAVCGAERIAQHANPGLLSSPVRLSAFSQNVIKRPQREHTTHTKQKTPVVHLTLGFLTHSDRVPEVARGANARPGRSPKTNRGASTRAAPASPFYRGYGGRKRCRFPLLWKDRILKI